MDEKRRKLFVVEEGDSMEVKTGFGTLKASGPVVVVVVIVLASAGVLGYMIRDHDLRNVDRASGIIKQVSDLKEAMAEQTFVLTLDEKGRKELRLDMPESLRRKTNAR